MRKTNPPKIIFNCQPQGEKGSLVCVSRNAGSKQKVAQCSVLSSGAVIKHIKRNTAHYILPLNRFQNELQS